MARCVPVLASLAVAATALGGCSGGSSPSGAPASTPSVAPVTPAPSTSASPGRSRKPIAGRTASDLEKVLLEVRDLPPGFTVKPNSGPDTSTTSSKDPKCAALVRMLTIAGPGATAHRVFTGGEHGPLIQETLTAEGSAKAFAGRTSAFRAALSACHAVTVRIPGRGTSAIRVGEIPAPQHGTGPIAFRLSGSGGPLDRIEITRVVTGVADVSVSMTFTGGGPGDITGATEIAVARAKALLATKPGT